MNKYDVIVIGGGHAGCEAAAASARAGVKTLLITLKPENLGEMSCNPAIGGVAKGVLVKEIDALDGLMGRIIDQAGIHYKMLNESKGPAVWGPRAQADRALYRSAMSKELNAYKNLDILFDSVEDFIIDSTCIKSVITKKNGIIDCCCAILTTGTFLSGMIHIGDKRIPAGRDGESPSTGLSKTLKDLNFAVARLKTGTPARLDRSTINYTELEEQPGDLIPRPFSELISKINVPQISCYITKTTKETHKIIKDNITKSAVYSDQIKGVGPRYCPSIEDKVIKFSKKDSHQIFLEPEGIDNNVVYPNGISTSLPENVQEKFIRTIPGLENVKILKYGYAIEYDYVDPRELRHTLETKKIKNLFFAGQINGTTGYEEAGGQGIVAGINAALNSQNKDSFILDRSNSYIGVMIDDLVTLGASEPYRMFTSRSEYRISLRADNADIRLTPEAINLGICSKNRIISYNKKIASIEIAKKLLNEKSYTTNELSKLEFKVSQDGSRKTLYQLLGLPNFSIDKLIAIYPALESIDKKILFYIYTESKYSFYIQRQSLDIKMFQEEEKTLIPEDLSYTTINSLSLEVVEKLELQKPMTIGAARRTPGVTPAAITAILIHLKTKYA